MELTVVSNDEERVRSEYHRCVEAYKKAADALREASRDMNKLGVWPPPPEGVRFKLPDERKALTHKFKLGIETDAIKVYCTPGVYTDGELGEIFLRADRQGSLVRGLMDSFATLFSIALQYGVPLERLVAKFRHVRFEPSGYTSGGDIRKASSLIDYIVQWLALRYMPREEPQSQEEPHE